jgi:glycosyltransferase involved in cell wall biosynthesis
MKIIQVVTQMEAAGAQKVAALLSAGLRDRGHDSELWFLYKKRPAYEESETVRVLIGSKSVKAVLSLPYQLTKLLRQSKVDALISHTSYANVICQPIASLCGVAHRIAVHHNTPDVSPVLTRIADRQLGSSAIYTGMIAVAANTQQGFDDYPASYRKKMRVIYNGIPHQEEMSNFDWRSAWGISPAKRVIMNVGRLSEQKNQKVLLEALHFLPDAVLIIFGEGELRPQLAEQILQCGLKDRVVLAGEMESAVVQQCLRQADVFAFPSLWEAAPMALIEAMRAGIPIAASDIVANRELLDKGGTYFKPRDGAEAARVIGELLDSNEIAREKSSIATKRSELFEVETMLDLYEALLT